MERSILKNKVLKVIIIITLILIIIDQTSKFLVTQYIREPVGGSIVTLEIVNNTGMALGFNSGNVKNIIITLFVLMLIIHFIRTQLERIDIKTGITLGIILAGGISNLIDRITRGAIVDFIKIYKFPIFNLADSYVFIGWILLIIFLIRYWKNKEAF